MNQSPFQNFISLVEFDKDINQLYLDRQNLLAEQLRIDQLLNELDQKLNSVQSSMLNLRKQIDIIELELKTLDEQERDKKHHLDNASSVKQYQSLLQEIQELNKKRKSFEDPLINLWQQLENEQAEFDKLSSQAPEERKQLLVDRLDNEKRLERLDAYIDDLKLQISELKKLADSESLAVYEQMKQRVSNPVAKVKNNSCGVCFYNISQQDLTEIKKDKLISCKDCYRLLYIKASENS